MLWVFSFFQNRHLLDKYLAQYANELLAQDQFEPLLAALRKFGSSPNPQLLPIYGTLVEKVAESFLIFKIPILQLNTKSRLPHQTQ